MACVPAGWARKRRGEPATHGAQVCLQKERLLVPGQLCTELYVLSNGALQITFPGIASKGCEADGGGAACRETMAGRDTMSPDQSRKTRMDRRAMGLKADRLRFRMCEKAGQVTRGTITIMLLFYSTEGRLPARRFWGSPTRCSGRCSTRSSS